MVDRIEVEGTPDGGPIVVERLISRRGAEHDGIVLSGAVHEELFVPGRSVRALIRALQEIDHG